MSSGKRSHSNQHVQCVCVGGGGHRLYWRKDEGRKGLSSEAPVTGLTACLGHPRASNVQGGCMRECATITALKPQRGLWTYMGGCQERHKSNRGLFLMPEQHKHSAG